MFDQIYTCEKLALMRIAEWQRAAQQQRFSIQTGRSRGGPPRRTTAPRHWDAGFRKFRRLLPRSNGAG